MAYEMRTKHGYSLFTMRSMLQKAIRRGDLPHAGFALDEMYESYSDYTWKTLLTISAEDCYGIMTKEIVALKAADDKVNYKKKGADKDFIFAAKAVVLLCMARKNRDACYVACNFMWPERDLTQKELDEWVRPFEAELVDGRIPEYVFDHHTIEGKKKGLMDIDMIATEGSSLEPHQMSLFDDASWGPYFDYTRQRRGGGDHRKQSQVDAFQAGKESDPTHGGNDWPM